MRNRSQHVVTVTVTRQTTGRCRYLVNITRDLCIVGLESKRGKK